MQIFNGIKNMERNTKQKKAIIDYLKSVKCHPDAETIYRNVKKKINNISLGTVYRILGQLSKDKKILELDCQDINRYDGDNSNHTHFICENCKCIIDIFQAPDLSGLAEKFKAGKISNYKIYLYGKCERCQK